MIILDRNVINLDRNVINLDRNVIIQFQEATSTLPTAPKKSFDSCLNFLFVKTKATNVFLRRVGCKEC